MDSNKSQKKAGQLHCIRQLPRSRLFRRQVFQYAGNRASQDFAKDVQSRCRYGLAMLHPMQRVAGTPCLKINAYSVTPFCKRVS